MNQNSQSIDKSKITGFLHGASKSNWIVELATKKIDEIERESLSVKHLDECVQVVSHESNTNKAKTPSLKDIPLPTAKSYVHEETKSLAHQGSVIINLCDQVNEKFFNKDNPSGIFVRVKQTDPFSTVKKAVSKTQETIRDLHQSKIENKEDFNKIRKKIGKLRNDLNAHLKKITKLEAEISVSFSNIDNTTGKTNALPWFEVKRSGKGMEGEITISESVEELNFSQSQLADIYFQIRTRYKFVNDNTFEQEGSVYPNSLLCTPKGPFCSDGAQGRVSSSPQKRIFEDTSPVVRQEIKDENIVLSALHLLKSSETEPSDALPERKRSLSPSVGDHLRNSRGKPMASISLSVPFDIFVPRIAPAVLPLGSIGLMVLWLGIYGFLERLKGNTKKEGPPKELDLTEEVNSSAVQDPMQDS